MNGDEDVETVQTHVSVWARESLASRPRDGVCLRQANEDQGVYVHGLS